MALVEGADLSIYFKSILFVAVPHSI